MNKQELVGKQVEGFLFDAGKYPSLMSEYTQREFLGKIATIVDYDERDNTIEVDFEEEPGEFYPASEAIHYLVDDNSYIFKKGDSVFVATEGFGEVIQYQSQNLVEIDFVHGGIMVVNKDYVSFTEYTLEGFSQEKPAPLPEVGELCLVKDKHHKDWRAQYFIKKIGSVFESRTADGTKITWEEVKRIKILD